MSRKPEISMVPVGALQPYEKNSRTHNAKQIEKLMASIKEFGFTNPLLIDPDGGVIAGHGRLVAAKKLGLKEVPAIKLGHLTPAQRRAYVIADNRLALDAGWDPEMLGVELAALELEGFDLGLTGFEPIELNRFMPEGYEGYSASNKKADEAPPVPRDPVSKLGDTWVLGQHRLHCGDSTAPADVKVLMGNERADCVWTDPPYNVNYEGKTKEALKIENDKMGDSAFRDFLKAAFSCMAQFTKPGGPIYVAHADSEGYNFRGAMIESGWLLKQCLIWVKSSLVMGRQDYQWIHEPILYGWLFGDSHKWYGDRKQTTVLNFDRPNRNDLHPTMKPVELVVYCLGNSSREGDLVLDLFGGSGTTLMAAEMGKRRARLMELDPRYVDVIVERWEKYTGLEAVHATKNQTFKEITAVRKPEKKSKAARKS